MLNHVNLGDGEGLGDFETVFEDIFRLPEEVALKVMHLINAINNIKFILKIRE